VVYEYGGLPYAIIPGGRRHQALRIVFSDSKNKSLDLLDVDTGKVMSLRKSATLRYGDFDVHPRVSDGAETAWVLAVEEDHEKPKPDDVRNYVVAINIETGEVKRVADRADFYSYPRFSPDAKKIAWKEWDHPDLPFQGCKIYWADWKDSGAVEMRSSLLGRIGSLLRSHDGVLTGLCSIARRSPTSGSCSAGSLVRVLPPWSL
jgi:hypothetical protein